MTIFEQAAIEIKTESKTVAGQLWPICSLLCASISPYIGMGLGINGDGAYGGAF